MSPLLDSAHRRNVACQATHARVAAWTIDCAAAAEPRFGAQLPRSRMDDHRCGTVVEAAAVEVPHLAIDGEPRAGEIGLRKELERSNVGYRRQARSNGRSGQLRGARPDRGDDAIEAEGAEIVVAARPEDAAFAAKERGAARHPRTGFHEHRGCRIVEIRSLELADGPRNGQAGAVQAALAVENDAAGLTGGHGV